MLHHLMFMMAATDSSGGRNSVGPKHTPRFGTVIKFLLAYPDTLEIRYFNVNRRSGILWFGVFLELFEVGDENLEHLEVGFGKFVDEIVDGRHS